MNDAASEVRTQVSEVEWHLRVDLAACYRLVALYGWDDLIFTHISARVPGPDHHFLINPYGLLFEEITASSLVKVDIDGRKVINGPYDINPAGFTIHSAIHAAREDAKCVLHLHSRNGVAVAAQKNASCRPRSIRSSFWLRSLTMITKVWRSMRTRSPGWFAIWVTSSSSCCATMVCSRSRRRSPMRSSTCTSSRLPARSKCVRKPAAS